MDVYKEWLGIPDGPRPPDHYELLRCVRFEDDYSKIRAHYKKLNAHVRKYATGQYLEASQHLLNELAKAMLCLTDPERKREYDESLGREFEAEREELGRQPLERVLVKQGHISRDQMKEAISFAEARGLSMRDAVVQMKLVKPSVAAQALALQLGRSYVDLEDMMPEDDVLDQVPRNTVKRHSFLPLFIDDGQLLIATVDEPEHELEDELRMRFGVPVRAVLSTPRAIQQAIATHYAQGARNEAAAQTVSTSSSRGGKAKPARPKFSELSEEEQSQRKQFGILIMCWAVILPVLIDRFLLRNYYPQGSMFQAWLPVLPFLVAPPAIWWVLTQYWK